MNKKINFIQIGFQKCGTTFLEKKFYSQYDDLNFVQVQNYRLLDDLFRTKLIMKDSLDFDKEEFIEDFNKLAADKFSNKKQNGFIYESLTFTYQKRFDKQVVLNQLKECFPNAKIIFFIRNQHDWIKSHYSQYIQGGGLLSLYDFIESMLTNPYLDSSYLFWNNTVSALYEIFGEKNVKVILYEELKESSQAVCDEIAKFVGLDMKNIDTSHVNKSYSRIALKIKRFLNHIVKHQYGISGYGYNNISLFNAKPSYFESFLYAIRYRFWKPITLKLCRKIDKVFNFRNKIEISDEHLLNINKKYAVNNFMLNEKLSRKLEKYGYPLI